MSNAYRVRSLGWYHRGCYFEATKPVDATARGLPLEELAEGIPEGEYCVVCDLRGGLPLWDASFVGRAARALGVFYGIRTVAEGENEEEARLDLYRRWEHISGLKLTRRAVTS